MKASLADQIEGGNRLRIQVASLTTLLLVGAIYSIVFRIFPLAVFWSPDEGAKFIQLQTMAWDDGLVYQIPYPGQSRDPAYRFYVGQLDPTHLDYGLSRLYPQRLAVGRVGFNWPIWFPLLTALPYRLFGLPGLYLIPWLSGLLTVALVGYLTARIEPVLAPITMMVAGLASPLFFYSFLFWEHTLVVLLGMIACGCALQLGQPTGRRWSALFLVGTLAAAVAIRLEVGLFAAALALGLSVALLRPQQRRVAAFLRSRGWWLGSAGVIVLGGLYLGSLWLIRGSGAGLLDASVKEDNFVLWMTQRWTSPCFWLIFPGRLAMVWVNSAVDRGPNMPALFYAVAMAGILLAAMAPLYEGRALIWLLISGGGLLGFVSLYVLVSPDRYRSLHGLFLVAPYLAYVPTALLTLQREKRFEVTLLVATALIYLAIGSLTLTLSIAGGLEWGPRYLLLGYPLGAIVAVLGLYQLRRMSPARIERWLLAGVVAGLVIISLAFEVRGLRELRLTKTNLLAYSEAFATTSRPVVTDLYWLPAVLAPRYLSQEIYVLPARTDLADWLGLVAGEDDTFVFASFQPLEAALRQGQIDAQPYRLLVESEWQRDGLTFTEFRRVWE